MKHYTEEEARWLDSNYKAFLNDPEGLAEAYNSRFTPKRKAGALVSRASRQGTAGVKYTEAQEAFLISHRRLPRYILTARFNEEFHENRTESAIRSKCGDLGAPRWRNKSVRATRIAVNASESENGETISPEKNEQGENVLCVSEETTTGK